MTGTHGRGSPPPRTCRSSTGSSSPPRRAAWWRRGSFARASRLRRAGENQPPDLARHRPEPVLVVEVTLPPVEPPRSDLDGPADEVGHEHHPWAQSAELPVERGVVERERASEGEGDGAGG